MPTLKEYTVKLTKLYLLSLLISSNAFARFLVEPQWRSYTGTYKGADSSGNLNGEGSVLNIGYIGDKFMAGLTLERGWLHTSSKFNNRNTHNFKYGGVGTFLGFHFFNRLKLSTGYLNTSLEPRNDNNYRYYGQQIYFGLGYRFWDIFIFNYEYMTNVYTQIEDDETGKTKGLKSNIRSNKQSLGLSLILVF